MLKRRVFNTTFVTLTTTKIMKESKPKLWNRNFLQCCISYFFLNSAYQMLMPIIPLYLVENIGIDSAEVGVVLASYTIGVLSARPFSGYLVDCFSRRSLYLLTFILFILLFICYLWATTPLTIMIVRFIQGAFMGVASVAGNTIAIDVIPSSRRSEGMGFYGLSINLAMTLSPIIAVAIYNTTSFNTLVIATFVISLIGGFTVTQIKYPPRLNTARPRLSLDRFILLKSLPSALSFILVAAPYGMVLSFAVLYGKEIGVAQPSYFFIFMAVGIGVSRLISGRLVDSGKIHSVLMCAISSLALAFVLLSLSESSSLFYFSGLVVGICYGVCVPAFQSLFVNIAPNHMRGTATSTYLSSFDLGSGLGMILAGYIAQHWSLATAYRVGGVLCLCSFIFYILKARHSYNYNFKINIGK